MLDETNDNLPQADGTLETSAIQTPESETQENVITLTPEEVQDESMMSEEPAPAPEASEVETDDVEETQSDTDDEVEHHEIPTKNYESMSMEELVVEMESLLGLDQINKIKTQIEDIKKEFLSQYHHLIDEKREEFVEQNPDTTEQFEYHLPAKVKFDHAYSEYRAKKNAHFKKLQSDLQGNLDQRLEIVESMKNLINPAESMQDTLKHFNELRDQWKNIGPIPKDKYNHVWNNYHFHVENFYDYLHLDREARDLEFKHNLELKQKLVERAEALEHEPDTNHAFRALQGFHRMWKEEIGPVGKDHREEIWNQFSAATKKIHDRKDALNDEIKQREVTNLEIKQGIIAKIEELAQTKVNSHALWLKQADIIEGLRNDFFNAGKVPTEANETTWSSFKNAVRSFNILKNSFYKDLKKDQHDNLVKKMALLEKAVELKDSTDFATTTPIMMKIQDEWKTIGHVPRKNSDTIWKEFRAACNAYFENLKEQRSEVNQEEELAFAKKQELLEAVKQVTLIGEHKADLDTIKSHIESWKAVGHVPRNKRHIDGKFNKVLDGLFEKLNVSRKDSEMLRFNNRVEQLAGEDDGRKLENEKIFIMRKIDEIQNEIFQLENNIQFFANAKNAKKENPIVAEVRKNIEKHKESMDIWKDKLKQLRQIAQ
ncbi:DUF349 domain-containing protein [Flavobacterium tegetincola]|uniref:DUF349 domain-containing protein n=1 Tax=Flavobacterium tegetincola TaxID=150172 RepID=UPI000409A045|nr:DUF349 domain-containing protein [Flavobacterium tegetincola]